MTYYWDNKDLFSLRSQNNAPAITSTRAIMHALKDEPPTAFRSYYIPNVTTLIEIIVSSSPLKT